MVLDAYVVTLPHVNVLDGVNMSHFSDFRSPEVTIANSPLSAVRNALFHKLLDGSGKKIDVMMAIRALGACGKLENFVHEIPTVFMEGGKRISQYDKGYRNMQVANEAVIIAKKKGDPDNPQKYMAEAGRYVDFHNNHRPDNYIN